MKDFKKFYKPNELEAIQKELKYIYDVWFGSTTKPKQSFVNTTITELNKRGYCIVKVRMGNKEQPKLKKSTKQ